jgi:hypothetical protein
MLQLGLDRAIVAPRDRCPCRHKSKVQLPRAGWPSPAVSGRHRCYRSDKHRKDDNGNQAHQPGAGYSLQHAEGNAGAYSKAGAVGRSRSRPAPPMVPPSSAAAGSRKGWPQLPDSYCRLPWRCSKGQLQNLEEMMILSGWMLRGVCSWEYDRRATRCDGTTSGAQFPQPPADGMMRLEQVRQRLPPSPLNAP